MILDKKLLAQLSNNSNNFPFFFQQISILVQITMGFNSFSNDDRRR
jgi:hypothetical protein